MLVSSKKIHIKIRILVSTVIPLSSIRLNFEFFYKLRKNAFGIFPICSDGFAKNLHKLQICLRFYSFYKKTRYSTYYIEPQEEWVGENVELCETVEPRERLFPTK